MKITSFIFGILALFSFVDCFADIRYARPLHITEGTKIIENGDKKYLLVDSAWMETFAPANANVKFDDVWLQTDRMNLSNGREKDTLSPRHDKLESTLLYRKTAKKYKQNSKGLPDSLKGRIFEPKDSLILRVNADKLLHFSLVINDTTLVVDTSFVTNKAILVDPTKLGLSTDLLYSITQHKNISIPRIQVLPQGHIPSYIKVIICSYNVEEIIYLDTRSTFTKIKEDKPWFFIVAGVIILSILGFVLYFLKVKNRKKNKPLNKPSIETPNSVNNARTIISIEPNSPYTSPEEEISKLKHDLDRLSRELFQEKNNSDIFKSQANQYYINYQQLKESVQSQIEKEKGLLRDNLDRVKAELKTVKDETKRKIDEARSEEKAKHERKIEDLSKKIKILNEDLDQEKKENKKKLEEVRKEEKEKSEKQISELNTSLNTIRDNLTETHNALMETKNALDKVTDAFNRDEQTIANLNEAQRLYTEHITFVEFAHQYASNVQCLLDIVAKINVSASKLIEANVQDPYLIYKAISRFSLAQSEINFENLATEVNMAASCKMTFSNNGIANLSGVAPSEQINSLRNYFLAAYLEKYINAVMVYNESLAGIDRLVKGLTPQHTAPFVQYREELKACFNRLGIVVISVKLFDTLGDNIDLKAKIIDYDDSLPAESIIEIQNCLVYPEGGRRPTDKIYVTAQR